jgi:hypothetical protein
MGLGNAAPLAILGLLPIAPQNLPPAGVTADRKVRWLTAGATVRTLPSPMPTVMPPV